ncbi:ROK family transcriptional regulator [Actinoallomurus purpureus]|uniref:ROK family transcriptional regulator n=1 Tax=Actinoallomurus purpureus TaxID=478114 RepID=UPI0020940001|nr:ROK family transcriptional regulator [Actinoallomurus purpureus]MCO6004239.1 ROK family transcriptional regulator [Actinoallomurus purpureus]
MINRYPAGPQRLLRLLNGRAVLEVIHRAGHPITTTDLAGRVDLSRPTVAAAVSLLLERGVISEVGPVTGRKGPAPALYEVNADCAFAIGVDVGHKKIRAAIADVTGRVRARTEQEGPSGRDALVERVLAMCEDLAGQVGLSPEAIAQVVMGVPAVVGPDGRALSYAAGLPDAGRGLGEALGRAIPAPLILENDVNLAALAERRQGHGTEVDDFVLVSLGVGLGLGMVVDGRVRRGATGVAGEAGYLPSDRMIAPPGQRRDLVQEHLGARYISAEARRLELPGDGSPRAVFELARRGDPAAVGIVDDTARSIAYVVACVVPLIDPALIVLGGAIGGNGDLLLAPVARHLADFSTFRPRIVASDLGPGAVLLGATTMASDRARESTYAAATAPSAPMEAPMPLS